jgi:hypothetical protein
MVRRLALSRFRGRTWVEPSTSPAAATGSIVWSCGGATSCPRRRCRIEIRWVSFTTAGTIRRDCDTPPNWAIGLVLRLGARRRGGAAARSLSRDRCCQLD